MPPSLHTAVIENKTQVTARDRCRSRQTRDEELVRRIRSGDRSAFDQLLEPHIGLVQYRVRSILQNDADVQDVVQEAMVVRIRQAASLACGKVFPRVVDTNRRQSRSNEAAKSKCTPWHGIA